MWVQKNKAFAYRVPIGDYNYLQCTDIYSVGINSVHEVHIP